MPIRIRTPLTRLVLVIGIAGALAGCIASERPIPSETRIAASHKKSNDPLHVFYSAGLTENTFPSEIALLKRVFEEQVTTHVAISTRPPASGVFIHVHETLSDGPPTALERVSRGIVYIIPYYKEGLYCTVDFDLYVDNVLRKTYRYEITRKSFTWLAVLPLSWINLLTNNHSSAFEATIYRFINEAHGDQLL